MFSITNEKVAGFTPRWADFRGFSILFDNPGDCLRPSGPCLHLACDVEHVTVWDGGNNGNAAFVVSDRRSALERLLLGLPDALALPQEMTAPALASPLVCRHDWDIEFRFDHLQIWGGVVMVARLSPTESSQEAFGHFVEDRRRLNASFLDTFGIRASENHTPHVSLGYFASREGAQLARPCLSEWDALFAERMQGLTLSFRQAGLYGFTDMATFFKAAEPLQF